LAESIPLEDDEKENWELKLEWFFQGSAHLIQWPPKT
jgi:hypothetical protein